MRAGQASLYATCGCLLTPAWLCQLWPALSSVCALFAICLAADIGSMQPLHACSLQGAYVRGCLVSLCGGSLCPRQTGCCVCRLALGHCTCTFLLCCSCLGQGALLRTLGVQACCRTPLPAKHAGLWKAQPVFRMMYSGSVLCRPVCLVVVLAQPRTQPSPSPLAEGCPRACPGCQVSSC